MTLWPSHPLPAPSHSNSTGVIVKKTDNSLLIVHMAFDSRCLLLRVAVITVFVCVSERHCFGFVLLLLLLLMRLGPSSLG